MGEGFPGSAGAYRSGMHEVWMEVSTGRDCYPNNIVKRGNTRALILDVSLRTRRVVGVTFV